VNGDGYDEVIVGAYHNRNFRGRAYVYAGSAEGLGVVPISTLAGESANTYFGRVVGSAGDVNGDGYDDVLVGAQAYDDWTGRIYVYGGSVGGLSTSAVFIATGEGPAHSFGRSAGSAGDVNADGYDDVVVGAFGYAGMMGRVYVYPGGPGGMSVKPIFTAIGENPGDRFGYSVGRGGDVNGDGYGDIIVGAAHYGDGRGRVYVYAGTAQGLSAVPIFTASGDAAQDQFGYSVGTAGDVDGDGYDDVVVGAWRFDGSVGRVYIYGGGPEGVSAAPLFTITGEAMENWFGKSVGTAGDVNGDDFADLVVGAYGYNTWTGRAYVYMGGKSAIRNVRAGWGMWIDQLRSTRSGD
jgi:hypothetical protein